MLISAIFIFLASILLIHFASNKLITGLVRISKFLEWKEFVVAFFVVALAGALPNLFVGLFSAFGGIPELSFGDVVGGNVVDLTLAVALATFFAGTGISAHSKTVQTTSIFTMASAILPVILILDGTLSRPDAVVLIAAFFLYALWLFSKQEHFKKVYNHSNVPIYQGFRVFMRDLGKIIFSLVLFVVAAGGIVWSASNIAIAMHIPLAIIGIFIVGLGNSFPEIYFAVASARRGETWMILGNLMGSIITPATLVLGIVALIHPIEITNFSPFAIGRFFLFLAAIFFFLFVRTDKTVSRKEGVFLLCLYIAFIIAEVVIL
ncbi:sodium:calcium antiporter [Patescibacteria group bacterium]